MGAWISKKGDDTNKFAKTEATGTAPGAPAKDKTAANPTKQNSSSEGSSGPASGNSGEPRAAAGVSSKDMGSSFSSTSYMSDSSGVAGKNNENFSGISGTAKEFSQKAASST